MKAKRAVSKDFRKKKAIFEAPSMELSSDSGSMEDEDYEEVKPQRTSNNMSTRKSDVSVEQKYQAEIAPAATQRTVRDYPSSQETGFSKPSDLLKAAAALHFGSEQERKSALFAQQDEKQRDAFRSSNSVLEARSTLSSPGKTNATLREKFRRMSRAQRKTLFKNRKNTSSPTQGAGASTSFESLASVPEQSASTTLRTMPPPDSMVRLERQSHYNSIGTVKTRRRSNRISLHIYDLLSQDALVQLPWGFVCEIGKCFNDVNSACHELGTGAYHVGVEVNGSEYAFGATNIPGKSGVFACSPKNSPGYQYRTTIEFGELPLVRKSWVTQSKQGSENEKPTTVYTQVEEYIAGQEVIKEMQREYMGRDYDILRKNCCTFARDACIRLGVPEDSVPSWFSNLAESGATTHDMALQTVEPIKGILATCEEQNTAAEYTMPVSHAATSGFEVVAERNTEGTKDILIVMESKPSRAWCANESDDNIQHVGFRRTLTWTY